MTTIIVFWVAFGDRFTASFDIPDCFAQSFTGHGNRDHYICELVYQHTNLYEGPFWDKIVDQLPEDRNHTALSTGDFVAVNGIVYECKDVGFEEVSPGHLVDRFYSTMVS